jgi:hypothetical protein
MSAEDSNAKSSRSAAGKKSINVDLDALLCALVLAPRTYSRNRFFSLYEQAGARRVRRRAARVRGIIRQLVGQKKPRGEIVGEHILEDGQVLLRYRVGELAFARTTALSAVEASALRYALHRAGAGALMEEDRRRVEAALERLGAELGSPLDR